MSDADREMALLEQHVNQLAEHFDSVQIFVTRSDPQQDGTVNANRGTGNWFTRYGQVRSWLVKADERSRQEVQKEES